MMMTMRTSTLLNWCLILGIYLQFSLSEISIPSEVMNDGDMWSKSRQLSKHTIDNYPGSYSELMGPVDKMVIQDDHLNLWRALRRVEVVANQNKWYRNLRNKVVSCTQQILETKSLEISKSKSQEEDKVTWVRKSSNPLHHVLSSFVKIITAHSSPDSHLEIEYVEKDIQNSFQFTFKPTNPDLTRDNFKPFMKFSLSKISFYILLKGMMKEKQQESGIYPSKSTLEVLKKLSDLGMNDVQYGTYYRKYMKTLESFEKLVLLGLQNKDVMIELTPSQCNTRSARKILVSYGKDNWTGRSYITNKDKMIDPTVDTRSLLDDPLKNVQSLGYVGRNARELWCLFDQPDLKISQELSAMNQEDQNDSIVIPQELRSMEGYLKIMKTIGKDSDMFKNIDNHISRCLGLILKVDEDDCEAQLVLWKILDCVLNDTSKTGQLNKLEKRIENSVMFYLLIRRIGKVMESSLSMEISDTPVTKSQCMQYYWSLLTYRTPNCSPHSGNITKALDLELGSLYKDHLISSVHMNRFYYKLDTYIQHINNTDLKSIPTQDESNDISALHSDLSVSVSDHIPSKHVMEGSNKSKRKNHTTTDERHIIQNLRRKVSVPRKKIKSVQYWHNDGQTEHIHEGNGNSADKGSTSGIKNGRDTQETGDENLNEEYFNCDVPFDLNEEARTKRTVRGLTRDPPENSCSKTVRQNDSQGTETVTLDITQTAPNELMTELAPGVVHDVYSIHKNPLLFDLNEPWEPSPDD